MVIAFIALMAWGLAGKEPPTARSGYTLVGGPAPGFTVPLFDGGELSLSDLEGRPVVVNFWASWCAPCREEALPLERAWQAYRERSVAFVGVDTQDPEDDARAYLAEFGVTYPNGRDGDGRVSIDYGIIGMPATFFIDRDGVVVSRWVGAIPEATLIERVEALLEN